MTGGSLLQRMQQPIGKGKKDRADGAGADKARADEHDRTVADAAGADAVKDDADAGVLRGRRFGIDVDGNILRVVELVDGAVVAFATYRGATLAESFKQFAATKPNGAIVVSWGEGDLHLRRVPLPTLPPQALRAGLLDAVEDSIPIAAGASAVAGRVFPGRLDGRMQAAVVAAEQQRLAPLFMSLPADSYQVVPTPLLFVDDGLYLGLRDGSAVLMLAAGGAAIATRNLAAGGMAHVRAALDESDVAPAERVASVGRGGGRLDPGAARAVDTYTRALSDEVRRTVDYWARQGLTVPSEIFVHGDGVGLSNLAGRLLDMAFLVRAASVAAVDQEAIARVDQPRAFGALLAATFDTDRQPSAVLANPFAAERVRRRQERRRTARRVTLVVAVVAVCATAFTLPVLKARHQLAAANADRDAVAAELNRLHPALALASKVKNGEKALQSATNNEVAWDSVLDRLNQTVPEGSDGAITALTAQHNNTNVAVKFTGVMNVSDINQLNRAADWIRELKLIGSVWASSVTRLPRDASDTSGAVDRVNANFDLTLPVNLVKASRGVVDAGRDKTASKSTSTAAAPAAATAATGSNP